MEEDEHRYRFKHGKLEDHGLKQDDFAGFFADHSLLMKKGDTDALSSLPDDECDDEGSHHRTNVCDAKLTIQSKEWFV